MQALASVLRNKLVLAVLGAAIVGSSAYAFAATLGVTSNSLGAGNASVAACTSALKASYTTAYDSGAAAQIVKTVKLSTSAASSCAAGYEVTVTFTGTGSLATTPVTVQHAITSAEGTALAAGASNITLTQAASGGDFTNAIPAETVTGIAVSVVQ